MTGNANGITNPTHYGSPIDGPNMPPRGTTHYNAMLRVPNTMASRPKYNGFDIHMFASCALCFPPLASTDAAIPVHPCVNY